MSVASGGGGQHPGPAFPGLSSPGVRLSPTGAFEPHFNISPSPGVRTPSPEAAPPQPPSQDGQPPAQQQSFGYRTADAARVGGGLYAHLLDAACVLATDPSPRVAQMGNTALRVARVELVAPVQGEVLQSHRKQ